MSNPKSTDPKANALAQQLKDSLAQRRLRPWKIVLGTLAVSVLLLGLLAWWMYPKPKPPPLQVMAFDVVCTTDEVPEVRAQLHGPPDDDQPRRMSGWKVIFREPLLPPPPKGAAPREIEALSDEHGQASLEWPLHEPKSTQYSVLHVDPDLGKGSLVDVGHVFVWPKDAPLLIVDADETLIAKEVDADASATLTKAAKEGWRIVYLAPAATNAHDFRKARRWLTENQAKLPPGPILGRKHYPLEEPIEEARADLLKRLQGKFTGKMLAVVKRPAAWADVPIKLK